MDSSEVLERARAIAFIGGCALLFWQYDGAAVDWLFGLGIAASVVLLIRGRRAFEVSWPHPLILVFLALTVAATVVARGSAVALTITIYLVLAALAFASALRGNQRLRRLTAIAIIAATAVTVATVALGWIARHSGDESLYFLTYDSFRSRGLFKDPNVAGGFLACAYPIAAAYAVRTRWINLPLLLLVTATVGTGVLLSLSRMALVVFVLGLVGVVAALALTRRWHLFGGFVVSAIIAAAVIGSVAVESVGLSNLPLWRYQIQAYDEAGRFVVWGFSWEMFRDAPLGTGAGSFEPRSLAYFTAAQNAVAPGERLTVTPSAHNTYLRVLVESGAIGFIAFMAFLGILLWRALRSFSATTWEWPLAFALVLVAGMAIDTLHWRQLWIYAAVIGGTMLSQGVSAATAGPSAGRRRRAPW